MKMKNIFKTLSGRPKNGNITETIRPLIFYPQLLFCIITMFLGFSSTYPIEKLMFSVGSIALAWQLGWGMSIERFIKSEKNKDDLTSK